MQCKYSNVIAIKHGINAALIAEHIYSQLSQSAIIRKDAPWIRMTQKQLTAVFPFLGKSAVRTALKKLIKDGILVREKFSRRFLDHAYYYSVTEYGGRVIQNDKEYDR